MNDEFTNKIMKGLKKKAEKQIHRLGRRVEVLRDSHMVLL